ncbi:zinc finger, CCHC-type containing protein [Tanacetum coccineum]
MQLTLVAYLLPHLFKPWSDLCRKQFDKENYLKHPIPAAPVAPLGQQVPPAAAAAHAAWVKWQKEVDELKAMFSKQAEQELLQTVREFHTCKQEEGQSVSLYVLKMKGYIDNLERLGQPNYNMHGMGKTVNELHAMLKLHEDTLPKKDDNPALHAIRAGRVQKNQKNKPHKAAKGGQGKGKSKMGYAPNNVPFAPKPKTPPPTKKDNPAKDAICHQCGEIGHWRRNCPMYLAELMKKKKLSQGASTSGCGTHICITTQGLRGSKKLKPGALSLYVGDGHRAAVEAIGTYHLELPSGLDKRSILHDVWVLVELPPNARTVGSKWLFKKKTDMDGAVYVFKARLVAKGFTQTYGVDYEETFSPVADIRSIRILIVIATYYDYEIWQMDVKTAFLNGHISEEVYMEQPEGFVNPKYPNHVCKLKRSIYGLKQASRQ